MNMTIAMKTERKNFDLLVDKEKKPRHLIVLWTRRARGRIDFHRCHHLNWVMLMFVSLYTSWHFDRSLSSSLSSSSLFFFCLPVVLSFIRSRTKQCNYMLSLSCYGYHLLSSRCTKAMFILCLFRVVFSRSMSSKKKRRRRKWGDKINTQIHRKEKEEERTTKRNRATSSILLLNRSDEVQVLVMFRLLPTTHSPRSWRAMVWKCCEYLPNARSYVRSSVHLRIRAYGTSSFNPIDCN